MFSSRLDESYPVEVRRSITPLTAAKISANSAFRFAAPFIATIAADLDVSLATLGGAIAAGELVGLTAPLLTRVAGRMTRRTAVWTGLLGIACAAAVCATSGHVVQFAIGLMVLNMSKIVFDLGIIAWITDRVAYGQLGRVIGLTETAWAGGLFIGVVLMGLLTGVTSWRWGYGLAIVAIVGFAALLRARLPAEPRPTRIGHVARVRPRIGAGWWVIAGTAALTGGAQALFVTFGKWLEQDFDYSETEIAIVIFCLGAVELLATSATVRFADQWGKQRSAMYGAVAIVPAGLGLAFVTHNAIAGLVMIAAFIAAFEFAIVVTVSLASNLVPGTPSAGLGFMVGAGTLGRAIMATPATAAFTRFGMWMPAVLGASCAAITVTCQWRYRASRRHLRQPA